MSGQGKGGQKYFDDDFVNRFGEDGRSKKKIGSMGPDGLEFGHAYLPAPNKNGKYPGGVLLPEPAMPGNYGPPSAASRAAQASANKAAGQGQGGAGAGSSGKKGSR